MQGPVFKRCGCIQKKSQVFCQQHVVVGNAGYVKAASPETVFNQLLGKLGAP